MEADDKVVPGNKMIFPAGIKDAGDRANLPQISRSAVILHAARLV
jgi:cytochrome c2